MSNSVNEFVGGDGVIRGRATRNKTTLIRANDTIKERPESSHKNFGNDLIGHIAETNRPEVYNSFRALNFSNDGDQGFVDILGDTFRQTEGAMIP